LVSATKYPVIGKVERLSPDLDALLAPDAQMEKLAEGFDWAEGPVWLKEQKALVFSDVPQNVVYWWSEKTGIREYLRPSGYTWKPVRGGEMGSNGLTTDATGHLVLCQHGDRRVARLNGTHYETLAEYYDQRRFNSPNDLCFDRHGNLYFTDPPYGLEKGAADPKRELAFCGVYLRRPNGKVELLVRDIAAPNGIALSPDQKTLYVAQSDAKAPVIMAFPVKSDATVEAGRIFFDASPLVAGNKGVPDGLKVDQRGNLWATGPGGVLILSPEGKHLGTLNTGEATANCGWGDDGSTLYITADMYLCRIRTRTKGTGF
jgi:gluconolactonase